MTQQTISLRTPISIGWIVKYLWVLPVLNPQATDVAPGWKVLFAKLLNRNPVLPFGGFATEMVFANLSFSHTQHRRDVLSCIENGLV